MISTMREQHSKRHPDSTYRSHYQYPKVTVESVSCTWSVSDIPPPFYKTIPRLPHFAYFLSSKCLHLQHTHLLAIMAWNNEKCLKLTKEFKKYDILWKNSDKQYHNNKKIRLHSKYYNVLKWERDSL